MSAVNDSARSTLREIGVERNMRDVECLCIDIIQYFYDFYNKDRDGTGLS